MSAGKNQIRRQRMLVALAVLMLGVYAIFGALDARSAQTRLADARDDLAEATRKIDEIIRLKQTPKVAALKVESSGDISRRIAAARQAAGLPTSIVEKEQPGEPSRIQRTDFQMRSTMIDLKPASLPQIITFCDALHDQETGALIRDITLTDPRSGANDGDQEEWKAQLVLTQMIFSPTRPE